jgi:cholesterol oxidase
VFDLVPLDGGGFEVHARHPGWAQRAGHVHHHTYTAEQVIVAAHAYGSAKLMHHIQHKGRLTGLSSELGKRARTNSEQLLYALALALGGRIMDPADTEAAAAAGAAV